jgi:DNA-binding CsgD family transcriptional regulator
MPTARARTALNRQFRFSFYHRRPVHCDFSGGQITSDAGLLPLRAFDQRHHLTRDGVQLLSDPRDDERVRHHSLALLRAYLRASQRMPIGRTVATGQCLQSCSHCSDAPIKLRGDAGFALRRLYEFCEFFGLPAPGPGRGRNVWPAAIATPGFRSAASPVFAIVPASAVDLIAAIRAVARGEAVCPPQLCKVLFDTLAGAREYTPSVRKIAVSLTRRQQELIPMIAPGLTNKEIASHLNLSEQTVKNHIHRMLRRIGADDRSRVIEIACAQDASD